MKKLSLLTLLFTAIIGFAYAQSVPKGMNYQAVARDKNGEILADKIIFLKVSLLSEPGSSSTVYYSEVKQVVTNKFGLFTHVIGNGSTLTGTWNEIPWSTKEIWMDVAIRMNINDPYISLSSTKLLAVPYAYHAGTASSISGIFNPYVVPGSGGIGIGTMAVPSDNWSLKGNSGSLPPTDYIGTNDAKDLVFKTNNLERLRILTNGNININNSLSIGVDLAVGRDAVINRNLFVKANAVVDSDFTVKRNVNLNSLGGATTNYGPFTVGSVSPSLLTGTLTVNRLTTLRLGLIVDSASATLLTGTLRVNNATDLYSSFTVNSKANSAMTGTLRVDSDVTFKQHLTLDNFSMQSTSSSTGALVVAGGVGIGRNLNVAGDANFGGHTSFAGPVSITDATPSTSSTTGALTVTGGTGIGGAFYLGGEGHLANILAVTGATTLSSTLNVTGATTLSSTLGVTGVTTLSAALHANGQVTINANPGGGQSSYGAYPLQVEGSDQGIAIKVTGSRTNGNNFISFWDNSQMWGRIEGETQSELESNNNDYKFEKRQYEADIAFGAIDLAFAGFDAFCTLTNTVAAATSATACLGLGACVTSPIPSLIASSVAEDVAAVLEVAATTASLVFTSVNYVQYKDQKATDIGVSYQSGAGDYAEYLEKADANEVFIPGDIIGVKGGIISKNTIGAEKVMVVSKRPIVLGNLPQADKIGEYEKVAFLGQVPVKVFGKVKVGDYILPNGNNNGVGVAISPDKIASEDIKNIVGIAWSSSESSMTINVINVAVGLNVNDNQKVVNELQTEVNALKGQIAETNSKLDKVLASLNSPEGTQTAKNVAPANYVSKNADEVEFTTPEAANIKYHEITREEILKGFEIAEKHLKEKGFDVENNSLLKRLRDDASFKESQIQMIQKRYKDAMAQRKTMDASGFNHK